MKQDKNEILARVILGKATEEEILYLQENCSTEELADIMDADDLAYRYRVYDRIDEARAYNKVMRTLEKHQKRPTRYITLWRAAAVILLLIVGGSYWWYRDYTKVTPPEISQEVFAAIQTSKDVGKSEASKETITSGKVTTTSKGSFTEDILQQLLAKVDNGDIDNAMVGNEEAEKKENKAALELLTTRHDKEFWLTLDDGTLVHMNANSRIIYPEKFSRDNREVVLSGEAYFMVAKDKSRPFIVHTQRGDVKVYGTEFNVNTRARDNSSNKRNCTSVVLVKGSVGVTPTEGQEYMLEPGQQIIIKDDSSSPYISTADLRPYLAWNTRKFDFDNYPLDGLMEIIYRWYHIDYVFADQKITKTKVSGSISRYETIEPLTNAIRKITGYDIQIRENTLYINY